MHSLRRWFFVAALAVASVWGYAIAGSGANLLTLFDGRDAASAEARVVVDQTALEPDVEEDKPAPAPAPAPGSGSRPPAAAESADGLLLQQISTDDLSAMQIMRLLEDEIASDTDPAAADAFLRAFGESVDTQE